MSQDERDGVPGAGSPVNPFPGPQPYRASDRGRFYGREAVSRELANTILAHRCVALYGPSGAGKSSVMQAGTIPRLDEGHDFRHVAIDGWPADEQPVAWLLYTLHTELKLAPPDEGLGLYESVEWIVRQAFRRSDRPILIYLDQLEQLLLPSREIASVEAFLDWLDRFAERPIRGLHLVLAMREDYLGRFRDRARGRHRLLENGFRLGPMTVGEIVGAVCQAAADGAPPQRWAPPAMRALMMQVRIPGQSESDAAEVQTAFAQIVCRALFGERAALGGGEGVDMPVHAEPILFRYLESTLEHLGGLRGAAERLLEEHLIAADGTRTLLTEEAARASGLGSHGELERILTDLERAAILRAEQHRGTRYFELGHDWLAKKVFDRKQDRAARAAEVVRERTRLAEQEAAAARVRAAEAETRRARRVIAIVTVFALLAGGLGIFAWTQQQLARAAEGEARAAEGEALAAQRRAEAEKERAERERERAHAAEQEALAAQRVAEAEKARAELEKARAEAEKERAEEAEQAALRQQKIAERARERAVSAESDALRQKVKAEAEARRASDANRLAVALSIVGTDPTSALALLREIDDPAGTRGWIPATVEALQHPASQAVLRGHQGVVVAARFSRDGALVATASEDGTARLARVDGAAPAITLVGHQAPLVGLAWGPDGRGLVSAAADGSVLLWPRDGVGQPTTVAGAGAQIQTLARSRDGAWVAVAGSDGSVRVLAVDGASPPRRFTGHEGAVRAVVFSPDGSSLATAGDDGTTRIWPLAQVDAAPRVLRGHQGTIYGLHFAADGRRVVTAGDDGTARIWAVDGAPGEEAGAVLEHADAVYAAEFSPDGARVVTASRDRVVRIWTPRGNGAPTKVELRGHTDKVYVARFDPRGERVATASRDGTARIWPVKGGGEPLVLRGHTGPVVDLGFSADARSLVTASEDGSARVWAVASAHEELVLAGATGPVGAVRFGGDGTRIIAASADGTTRIWTPSGRVGGAALGLAGGGAGLAAVLSPDGRRAVTGGSDGKVRVWALGAGTAKLEQTVDLGLAGRPTFMAISADGRQVLTSSSDVAVIIELESGVRTVLRGHEGKVQGGAFSADGSRLVTVGDDRTARVWSRAGSAAPIVLRGHKGAVYGAAFSPDGARVVTASWDRTARVWSADGTGVPVVLAGHAKAVRSAEFSGDGLRVITASDDHTAKVWRSDGSGDAVTLHGHEGAVRHASFSPEGQQVVTGGVDGKVRVWAADFDNPELLRGKITAATTVCLIPEQRVKLLGEPREDAERRHQECERRSGR
jgi:WD40 repeat protein